MENRQSRPGGASGHGGQKFHQDSEQAKLHKSKLRMESREEKLGKARDRLVAQKPPKKPGPVKRAGRWPGPRPMPLCMGKSIRRSMTT